MSDLIERLLARKANWMQAIEVMEEAAARIKELEAELAEAEAELAKAAIQSDHIEGRWP